MVTELRQKRKLMGHLGAPGREEIYCDKDRAAAVAMGDQDIKTSLKVTSPFIITRCKKKILISYKNNEIIYVYC